MMIATRQEAIDALGQALMGSAEPFDTAQRLELIDAGLTAVSEDHPLWERAELTMVAEQELYEFPAVARRLGAFIWSPSVREPQPWNQTYYPLPRTTLRRTAAGLFLSLLPPPSALLIAQRGATAYQLYAAGHVLPDEGAEINCTLTDREQRALILYAMAEAMQRLAASGVVKPVQVHRGLGASLPANAAPAALAKDLFDRYRRVITGQERAA